MHLTVYYPHAEPTVTLQRWPACCLVRPAPRRDPYPACIARGAARTYKVESEGGTGLRPARRNPPASWPRLAEAGGRPALALMALAGRIEAGGRGGRSLWAATLHVATRRPGRRWARCSCASRRCTMWRRPCGPGCLGRVGRRRARSCVRGGDLCHTGLTMEGERAGTVRGSHRRPRCRRPGPAAGAVPARAR